MCRWILGLTMVVAMFWSAASRAQSTHQQSPVTETAPRESLFSLLARSELQAPKPIPAIRPLRFQEIPVGLGARRGADNQPVASDKVPASADSQQETKPALLVLPQTNVAH